MEQPLLVYRGIPTLVIELFVAGEHRDIYFPGDIIRGKLAINVKAEKERIKHISIKLKGISEVRWIDPAARRGFFRFYKPVKVSRGQEIYCNYVKNLLDSDDRTFTRGKHRFKFQFRLPKYSPSTFEGSFGDIRYLLTLEVAREEQPSQKDPPPNPVVDENAIVPFIQSTAKKTITSVTTDLNLKQLKEKNAVEGVSNDAMSREFQLHVCSIYDLNKYPQCRLPLKLRSVKRYRRCGRYLGRCETTVELPVSGFCPGQTVPATLRCDNSSRLHIKDITFSLRRTVTYHGNDGDKKTKSTQQATIEFHKPSTIPVKAHTILLRTIELKLQRIIKTYDVSMCSLIDIDYDFVVTTCPENKRHSEAITFQKCILGNYPLRITDTDNPPPIDAQNAEELVPSGPLPGPSSTQRSRYESSSDVSIDEDQFSDSDTEHNLRMSHRDRRHRTEPPSPSGVSPIKADQPSNTSTIVMIHHHPSKASNPPELDPCTPGPSRQDSSRRELSKTGSSKPILSKLYTTGKPKASYDHFVRKSVSSNDIVAFDHNPVPMFNPFEQRSTLPRVKSRTKNTIPTAPIEQKSEK